MNKNYITRAITNLVSEGKLNKDDIVKAFNSGLKPNPKRLAATITEPICYLGALLIFLGMAIYLWQNWDLLTEAAKVITTLGMGVAVYWAGLLFGNRRHVPKPLSRAFYFMSALIMTFGFFVVGDIYDAELASPFVQLVISGALLVIYLLTYIFRRSRVFILLGTIFATWSFVALTNMLAEGTIYYEDPAYYFYRAIIIGLTYMLLGKAFNSSPLDYLTGWLSSAGAFILLAAVFMLGGFGDTKVLIWDIIFPVAAFGLLLVGLFNKNRFILTLTTLFLVIFAVKITYQYNPDSVIWPSAIVFIGIVLIALGWWLPVHKEKSLRNQQG